ncbi:hypothetical protein [Streptomyces sp. NBC_00826]|uniref:hypothetical protein n=1 Tax=Streptomyces sp. NBC_00826 TaxID=2975845 RepID=UPI002F91AE5D|nr:hypothetical protein OG832_44635 [Streptomyces sp. NBC_00826]WTB60617.1 hypothetical protein OG832_47270 [Streptomyces sp. NBC_00826]
MRRTAAVLTGTAALTAVFIPQAVAAPAEIIAPNARAAAEVNFNGALERQKNVTDSHQVSQGLYCVIVNPSANINLSNALILANGGPSTTSVSTIGKPTLACDSRRDAITVVTLRDGHPVNGNFTIAVL